MAYKEQQKPITSAINYFLTEKYTGTPVLLCNFNHIIISSNKAFEQLFGNTQHIINNQTNWFSLFVKDDISEIRENPSKLYFPIKLKLITTEGNYVASKIDKEVIVRDESYLLIFNISESKAYNIIEAPKETQKEQSLAESNKFNKYRLLFDNIINGVVFFFIQFDENKEPYDFVVTDTNQAIVNLIKLPKEAIIGKSLRQIFPEANSKKIASFAQKLLPGKPIETELFFTPLGKHFQIISYSPREGHYAVIFRDISNEKRALEELKESKQLYKLIAENTSDVIWMMDLNMNNTYISPSTLKFRGYTVEEHLNQSHEEILSKESLQKLQYIWDYRISRITG